MIKNTLILGFLIFFNLKLLKSHAQTPIPTDSLNRIQVYEKHASDVLWSGKSPTLMIQDLAAYCAPILWFSPDEPSLNKDYKTAGIKIPEAFPFDFKPNYPIVYYKIPYIFTNDKTKIVEPYHENISSKGLSLVNLSALKVIYIEYYFYYSSEEGLGSHEHDIESIILKLVVDHEPNDGVYKIYAENVIGRAHGLYWYNNMHVVSEYTKFPITVFIEEAKHASCPDSDGDGNYTPSFDVNTRINDAWGVRDIIHSGKLFTGSYQSWMTKRRNPNTLVVPPLPDDSPLIDDFKNDVRELPYKTTYQLRPFPENIYNLKEGHLKKLVESKKPRYWPLVKKSYILRAKDIHVKEDKEKQPITIAYRWESGQGFVLITPLLLFKNVSAPMTGGWFVNKFYSSRGDLFEGSEDATAFGHMIMHTSSASRWLDTFIGMGYEVNDYDPLPNKTRYKTEFAGEFGIKIRGNLKSKLLGGTRFLGIRLGLKTTGFNPTKQLGTLIEFGAGVW